MDRKKSITWQEGRSRLQNAKIKLLLARETFRLDLGDRFARCTFCTVPLALDHVPFSFGAFNFEVPSETRLSRAARGKPTPSAFFDLDTLA